jgi:DNA-binding NarL/FixJ family response regulator
VNSYIFVKDNNLSGMGRIINVIIADDHPIFRAGLRQIVESDVRKISAEASNGEEALEKIKELQPDIAILDINMPLMDGLGVLEGIKKSNINTRAIILTAHQNEKIFNKAMDMGAYGYVLKENASSDLIECIHTVSKDEYYISPIISNLLFNRNKKKKEFEEKFPEINSLTDLERKILKMIAEQKSSKEIADELFISSRTVDKHRENISHKLNIHGCNAILKFAIDNKSSI